jgi:hypothetical protein
MLFVADVTADRVIFVIFTRNGRQKAPEPQ